jgi:2-oxoglutarate dehydrogenase E2 component (dihydrolipoamide succinyltransferase)
MAREWLGQVALRGVRRTVLAQAVGPLPTQNVTHSARPTGAFPGAPFEAPTGMAPAAAPPPPAPPPAAPAPPPAPPAAPAAKPPCPEGPIPVAEWTLGCIFGKFGT